MIQVDATHMTSLFENATEGILLTNGTGNLVLVNPAAERIFGYSAEELIGEKIEVLLPESIRRHHEQLRNNFYHDPQNRVMGHGRDLNARKKDGTDFPVEISLSHYRQGPDLFVIVFIIDITIRKGIEKDMVRQQHELEKVTNDVRQLNAELEAKVEERTLVLKEALSKLEQSQKELRDALSKEKELNEIKGRFVSMASHEFRTPLSTVLSSASLLSKYIGSAESEKQEKHIGRIKESVKHLNDILEDFLNLGKLDEGKVTAQNEKLDVKQLIEGVIQEMTPLLKAGQTIKYLHIGDTDGHTDRNLLKNVLINLISNAIKFSSEDSAITLHSEKENEMIEIVIKDNGIGISLADQEHLFTSFFRGKNASNIQGTGLGLHIVKRNVNLLGGDVKVVSVLNSGTSVSFAIPVNKRT